MRESTPGVMAGLVPAIHVFPRCCIVKTWMSATSAGMTAERLYVVHLIFRSPPRKRGSREKILDAKFFALGPRFRGDERRRWTRSYTPLTGMMEPIGA